jgi:hypothetical protein
LKLAFLILFNLVTAVGGHFVNRRWDKAFLLFVAMMLILSLPWFYLLTASAGFNDLMPIRYYPHIQLAIILCFSLLSTSLFVIDYRRPAETSRTRWTKTMTVAAGVFCLVSTFYMGWFVSSYLISAQQLDSIRGSVAQKNEDDSPRTSYSSGSFFNEYIYFSFDGGDVRESMPAPPPGDAVLYGTITRNDAPVEGIELDVVLGGGFKVESLVTDANGRFSFPVTPGTWNVNAILVSAWRNKPGGEYVIVTGRESQAGEDQYYKNRYGAGDLTIDAKSGESTAIVAMEINPAVRIISPASNREKPVEDASGFTIEWEKNDRAAFYIVSLSKVTEEGTITSFHPISQLRTEALLMDLSGFTVFDDPGAANTYSVNLNAFDQQGNFVSESKHMGRHMFTLTGFKVAADAVVSELGDEVSEENYEEFYQNNKKIDAVETLLENQLVAEAEKVVALITENSRAGKIDALKGYILAIRGDCASAKLHFEKAIKDGGISCLPRKYRQSCL